MVYSKLQNTILCWYTVNDKNGMIDCIKTILNSQNNIVLSFVGWSPVGKNFDDLARVFRSAVTEDHDQLVAV